MITRTLLEDAADLGLIPQQCRDCGGTGDRGISDCHACEGSGYDRTPWGIIGAILLDAPEHFRNHHGASDVRINGGSVCIRIRTGNKSKPGRVIAAQHNGTPESMANAALTAWLGALAHVTETGVV